MVPEDFALARKHGGTVRVEVSGGGQALLYQTGIVSTAAFQQALIDAVRRSGVFASVRNDAADYLLRVRIVAVVPPAAGLREVASMSSRWTLTSARDGAVVFDDVILSRYAASAGSVLVYGDRVMLEGVARQNVKSGIEALSAAKLPVTGS